MRSRFHLPDREQRIGRELHIASGRAECAGYHRRRYRREHLRELRDRLKHAWAEHAGSLAGAGTAPAEEQRSACA